MIIKNVQKAYNERYCVEVFCIEDGDRISVSIFKLPNYGKAETHAPDKWGVNWGGHGTQNSAYANKYATLILLAAEEAEKNNELEA